MLCASCFWKGTSSSGYIQWSKTWFTRLHPWRRTACFATCILSGERLLNLSCIEVIHVHRSGRRPWIPCAAQSNRFHVQGIYGMLLRWSSSRELGAFPARDFGLHDVILHSSSIYSNTSNFVHFLPCRSRQPTAIKAMLESKKKSIAEQQNLKDTLAFCMNYDQLACFYFCVPFSTRPRPKWSERPMRYLGHAELLRIFFAPRRTIWSKWMQSMTPIQTSYRIFIQLFRTESRCTDFQLPFDLHNLHSLHSTIGFQWFVPSPRAKDPGHVCDSRHSWRILPKVAAGEGLVDVAFQENAQYEEFIPRHWPIWHNLAHCNGVQNIGMILCPCNPILGILYNPTVCIHNYTHTHIHITSYYIILIHITHITHDYTPTISYNHLPIFT